MSNTRRKYPMKVADMKALAEKCARECAEITAGTRAQQAEATRKLRGMAVVEALGRLEALDHCRRLVDLFEEYELLVERIRQRAPELAGIVAVRSNADELRGLIKHQACPDTLWDYHLTNGRGVVRAQAEDVIAERCASPNGGGLYEIPNPNALLEEFKNCGDASEVLLTYLNHKNKAKAFAGLPTMDLASQPTP